MDEVMKHIRFVRADRERIKAMKELPPEAKLYILRLEVVAQRSVKLREAVAGTDKRLIQKADHELANELEFLGFLGEDTSE